MTKKHASERMTKAVDITELEPRICFSQSPAGVVVPEPVWDGTPDQACSPQPGDAVGIVHLDQPDEWQLGVQGRLQQELVFIDSAVDDREQIITQFSSRNGQSPVSIFVLDGMRDGVDQLTGVLAHFDRVSAVHLFSHGAAGQIQLGNTLLSTETLSGYAAQLTRWQDSLTWDADLLIYGCDVAASEDGEELLESMHVLTSADVAASVDLTGHASFGGDWELEFVVGDNIEAQASLGPVFAQMWNHDLSIPVTSEQLVNENYPNHDTNRQQNTMRSDRASDSAVAVANNGKHVVVWTSRGTGGDGDDVFFQLYDTDGSKIGSQVMVNDEFTHQEQNSASVAMDANGNFVVVWSSKDQDGSSSSVYYRRYNSDGDAQDSAVRATINSFSSGQQRDPDIAMNDAGQFAIVWEGEGVGDTEGIFARIFDPSGNPYDDPFLVNSNTTIGTQSNPAVGIDGVGNIVVAWNQTNQHIAAGYYALDGTPGPSFDTTSPLYALMGESQNASVSVREDGLIAIAYEIKPILSSNWDIHVQLFKAGLTIPNLSPVLATNQSTSGDQLNPSVWFSDTDDTVVVTWDGEGNIPGHADDHGVFARRFRVTTDAINNPTATPLADEFRVNVTTSGDQGAASVAGLNGNNFVVVWSGRGPGDNDGIFMRSFDAAPFSAGDDTADVLEDSTGDVIDVRSNDSTSGVVVTTFDVTGTRGTVTNHGDGTFTYNPNGQFESLPEGATAVDTFSYTITNGVDTSSATVTVTVTGQNDSPTTTNYISTTDEEAVAYSDNLLSLATDTDDGAVLLVNSPTLISGNAIGVTIDAAAGTISIDPSQYQYLHSGDQEIVAYSYNVIDEYGATASATATVTINGRDDDPQAVDDSWGIVPTNTPVTIDESTVLGNDRDADGDTLILLDYVQPAHGTLVDLGASLEYTPDHGYFGADSFDYLLADSHNSPQHYWRLDGSAADVLGTNDGTLFGTTTAAGSFGNGLAFDSSDATDDYVRVPDVTYGANLTISFDFYIDDNDGTGFRYLYSHGPAGAPESINVFLREAQNTGSTAPNTLATVVDDGNDITDLNALNVDASGLIGGWHTYTLTVESGVGTKVYIDGVLQAGNTDGADGVNPNTDVYLGAREDLSSTRFFDGRLDSVRIYDRKLELAEIAQLHTIPTSLVATVGLTVADLPDAQDDAYALDQGQTLNVPAGPSGLLANDTGSGTLTVHVAPVTGPAHGTLNLNTDGSFSYQPDSVYSGPDSFVYEISSTYGGPSQATVSLTVQPNAPPTAVDDTAAALAGQTITIAAWQNDSDPESAIDLSSYTLSALPLGASVINHSDGTFDFRADTAGVYAFTYEFRDSLGQASNTATVTVTVSNTYQVTGTVYEDIDGDGDVADDGVGAVGVSVTLYRDNGDGIVDAADLFVASMTTDGSGRYAFANLNAGVYFVVVDSRTITPKAGLNTGYAASDLWADQTYGAAGSLYFDLSSSQQFTTASGTHFGGSHFDEFDDASTLATSEHVIKVGLLTADANQRDFGFSFNVVTNVLAGDFQDADAAGNGRTVQGSLRQFIANANAIAGGNAMRFVPAEMTESTPGTYALQRGVAPTQTGAANAAWWQLNLSRALPTLTDHFTVLDGTAYNATDGVSLLNTNANLLGYRGTVGVYDADGIPNSGDEWSLGGLSGPELEIVDRAGIAQGLHLDANDITVRHLAIHGFGDATNVLNPLGNIVVGHGSATHIQRVRILDNVLGSAPDAFAAPTASANGADLVIRDTDDGLIRGNLIGFADSWGVVFMPSSSGGSAAWSIISNEIRGNARVMSQKDGIDLVSGSTGTVVRGNLITDNGGSGIDAYQNVGSHVIEYNTVSNNGFGGLETSGIRLFGSGSQIRFNDIVNNQGTGVLVMGAANPDGNGLLSGTPAMGNTISQNQFGGNGGVAIDLLPQVNSWLGLGSGNGVSPNDGLVSPTTGNIGLDSPDILSATINGTTLTVSGQAAAGGRVEVYLAAPGQGDHRNGDSYGEGVLFLGSTTADASGNFVFIKSNLPPSLDANSLVSAIVIDGSGNTSEFGKNKGVNATPVANADAFSLLEDSTLVATLAANDADDDGDTLNYSLLSGPAHGSLNLNPDGTFDFTPDVDYFGYDSFIYRVSDGQGGTADATVTINVAPVNDGPQAVDDAYSVSENGTLNVTTGSRLLLNDSDVDGDTLRVLTTPVVDVTHGALTLQDDGTFSYTPQADYHGTDSFVYRVSDGQGGTADASVIITVMPVNSFPTATADLYVTWEDVTLTVSAANGILLNDGDPDGDAMTVDTMPVSAPVHGMLTLQSDGAFSYVPRPDFHGTDSFVYSVRDGQGGQTTALVQITVQPVNDAPVARDDQFTLVKGARLALTDTSVLDNDLDVDGDTLTGNLLSDPTHGQLTWRQDGTFEYVHDGSNTTSDTFTYQVQDVAGDVGVATVKLKIQDLDTAPRAVADTFTTFGQLSVTTRQAGLLSNDVDDHPDSLAATVLNPPAHGSVTVNADGTFLYTPDAIFLGPDQFQYMATDAAGQTSTTTVRIEVLAPPPPIAPNDNSDQPTVDTNQASLDNSNTSSITSGAPTVQVAPAPVNEERNELFGSSESTAAPADVDAATAPPVENATGLDGSGDSASTNAGAFTVTRAIDYLRRQQDTVHENATQARSVTPVSPTTLESLRTLLSSHSIQSSLNQLTQNFQHSFGVPQVAATGLMAATSTFTVGYVAWAFRAGYLMASVLTTVPTWQTIDPMPILSYIDDEDDDGERRESLESLISRSEQSR